MVQDILYRLNNYTKVEEKVRFYENYVKNIEINLTHIINDKFEFNEEFVLGNSHRYLVELNNHVKQLKASSQQHKWISDGNASFVDLLKSEKANSKELFPLVLSNIVRYVKALQGGIFLVDEFLDADHFELVASYAYGENKLANPLIPVDEGMLGQCYKDSETRMYTDIPEEYTKINSGLGKMVPNCIVFVPMRFNLKTVGVIELAGFKKFETFEIDFIEKMAENLASVWFTIQNTASSKKLIEEAKLKELQLREQEEELRQNVEELITAQEEMSKKQIEIDSQNATMKLIIDNIPFPVFVKDEEGKYTLLNIAETALFGMKEQDILGKSDRHFVESDEEWEVIKESDAKTLQSNVPIELPVQSFTTKRGSTYYFKTTKIPFFNSLTGKKNILGVSVDLTEKRNLEQKLVNERIKKIEQMVLTQCEQQKTMIALVSRQVDTLKVVNYRTFPFLKLSYDCIEDSSKTFVKKLQNVLPEIEEVSPMLCTQLSILVKEFEAGLTKVEKIISSLEYTGAESKEVICKKDELKRVLGRAERMIENFLADFGQQQVDYNELINQID